MSGGERISTPYFLVDEGLLRKNLKILREVQEQAGCKILLAQKAFSMFYAYPLIRNTWRGAPPAASMRPDWDMRSSAGRPTCSPRPTGRTSLRSC